MFSRICKRLTVTNLAAVVVLVLAMSGGAYAAGKYVITSTKQISPKVLKSLKGAKGPAGRQGVQGVAGATGAPGPEGKSGVAGKEGALGAPGTPGKDGENGKEGSPWTAGGLLPSGKTLRGQWSIGGTAAAEFNILSSSESFGLPLATAPTMYYIKKESGENEAESKWAPAIKEGKCKGNVQNPEAAPGSLCVFANEETNNVVGLEVSAGHVWNFPAICNWEANKCAAEGPEVGSRFGFGMKTFAKEAGEVNDAGTWAVTAK